MTPSCIPAMYQADVAAMPAPLQDLLEAELAAGNVILSVGHSFPAPPVGSWVMLARAVSTAARVTGPELRFRTRNSALYSGEFTDADGVHFVLEAPLPPPSDVDTDAVRAEGAARVPALPDAGSANAGLSSAQSPLVRQFGESMVMNYERWHDGTGYDLEKLRMMSAEERRAVRPLLFRGRSAEDDEALDTLDTLDAQLESQAD